MTDSYEKFLLAMQKEADAFCKDAASAKHLEIERIDKGRFSYRGQRYEFERITGDA